MDTEPAGAALMLRRLRKIYRRVNWFSRTTTSLKANAEHLDRLERQIELLQRETRLLLGQLSLPPTGAWMGRLQSDDGAPASGVFPYSTHCRQDCFEQAYFAYWTRRLKEHLCYHRKLWEFVFICQALWERGAIRRGARGLGFGVGREPLAALFAAEDCQVVATDLPVEDAIAAGWSLTNQHAVGLEALRKPSICDDEAFNRNVEFRFADMNQVPTDLTEFDFCWSACAFEHLGSIEQGLQFIERIVDCLKPGGWAVHTTEFNLSSNDQTLDHASTVLFRRGDMEALAARLTAKGHQVAPFDFQPGLAPLDRYIDVAPYRSEPHLRMAIGGYATTSFGFIVQRGA